MNQNRVKKGLKTAIFRARKHPKTSMKWAIFEGCNSDSCSSPQCQPFQENESTSSENESTSSGNKSTFSVQDEYKIYWLLITDYLRVYRITIVTHVIISGLLNVRLGSK